MKRVYIEDCWNLVEQDIIDCVSKAYFEPNLILIPFFTKKILFHIHSRYYFGKIQTLAYFLNMKLQLRQKRLK